ncbi:unnamed protein product, partial [Angiostrongylus costaricensis]|uniref:Protein-tyrosine phosphatase n=1 Tax=Angiostrongylus costaricensis TaxID=334426 RepID=A0A0R3PGB1_ANGCS
ACGNNNKNSNNKHEIIGRVGQPIGSNVDSRYDDVICIDSTRVILKERPPDDDYIHANWMIMPDQTKYICTQGPIQETLVDFWQMIFTEKSTVIVMLCAFKEGKNEKCALYHPKTKTECGKFGPYRVFLRETMPNPFNTVNYKIFTLKREKSNSIEIHHLACSEWPDHTAPLDPGPIVGMLKMARSLSKGNPITVHCSAGIGRSATFIDYAMQKIKEDSSTSMVEVLKELRKQRFQSVQGIIQYIFLHICLLEAFADVGFYVILLGDLKNFRLIMFLTNNVSFYVSKTVLAFLPYWKNCMQRPGWQVFQAQDRFWLGFFIAAHYFSTWTASSISKLPVAQRSSSTTKLHGTSRADSKQKSCAIQSEPLNFVQLSVEFKLRTIYLRLYFLDIGRNA